MKIPRTIVKIIERIEAAGFEAFVVGGPVRDFLLGAVPKDWDLTTNALPAELQKLFPHSFYNNNFGTVTVITDETQASGLKTVEVTTYRTERDYQDHRHPSVVEFTSSLEKDLSRRDFTVNAMALALKDGQESVVDPFGGQNDLAHRTIRAVGEPATRFREDALRMMRAVRFAVWLEFEIESQTMAAIRENCGLIGKISAERIRDELVKIILSANPARGVELLRQAGLMAEILPELEATVGVTQNRHHIYTVYEHLVNSLKACPSEKLEVRLAALFHDIAKPATKAGEGETATFYNHEYASARVTKNILRRLKFSNAIVDKTSHLVRNHMFYYNTDEVSEAGVRRLIKRVGPENLDDLMQLRIADRLGSGTPKAKPYKLRHLEYLIEKVSKDPISPKMLKINGEKIMEIAGIAPGPKVGAILKVLLAEVIEEPKRNTKEYLIVRAGELNELSLEDIKKSEAVIEGKKADEDAAAKKKFWVK